MAFPKKVK